jgi:small subunit ribosomal protein S14
MAKKSMIEREKKRSKLVTTYATKRCQLKINMKTATSLKEKLQIQFEFQKLPRNSAPTRLHNRCMQTGRPHAYYRDFGLCRHSLREMAHKGLLPGVTKASW